MMRRYFTGDSLFQRRLKRREGLLSDEEDLDDILRSAALFGNAEKS
jgi:hypothetical protein